MPSSSLTSGVRLAVLGAVLFFVVPIGSLWFREGRLRSDLAAAAHVVAGIFLLRL